MGILDKIVNLGKRFGTLAIPGAGLPITAIREARRASPTVKSAFDTALPIAAGAVGGPVAGVGASALWKLNDRFLEPQSNGMGAGGGRSAIDQIATGERGAFEGAANAFLSQTTRGTAQANQALGQSFANRGINDSPLAASLISQQSSNRQQSALDRVAQERFGLESRIAERDFRREIQREAIQSGLDTELIAGITEIGFELLSNPDIWAAVKDFFSDDELSELFPGEMGLAPAADMDTNLDNMFADSGFIPPNATSSDLERLLRQ